MRAVFITMGIAMAVTLAAQDPAAQTAKKTSAQKTSAKKTSAKKTSAKKTTAAPPVAFLTIPATATENPNGTYSYTDKDGKKWSYWKSPFGVMRTEVKDAPADSPVPAGMAGVVARDKGETVRFERQTPFGPMGYERKKSEMTDDERAVFEQQHPESKQAKPE